MYTAEDRAMTHILGNCCTTPTATTSGWSRGLFFFLSMLNPKASHESIILCPKLFPPLSFSLLAGYGPTAFRAAEWPAFTGWKLKVWSKSRMWMQHKGTTSLLAWHLCVCIHTTMKGGDNTVWKRRSLPTLSLHQGLQTFTEPWHAEQLFTPK